MALRDDINEVLQYQYPESGDPAPILMKAWRIAGILQSILPGPNVVEAAKRLKRLKDGEDIRDVYDQCQSQKSAEQMYQVDKLEIANHFLPHILKLTVPNE